MDVLQTARTIYRVDSTGGLQLSILLWLIKKLIKHTVVTEIFIFVLVPCIVNKCRELNRVDVDIKKKRHVYEEKLHVKDAACLTEAGTNSNSVNMQGSW